MPTQSPRCQAWSEYPSNATGTWPCGSTIVFWGVPNVSQECSLHTYCVCLVLCVSVQQDSSYRRTKTNSSLSWHLPVISNFVGYSICQKLSRQVGRSKVPQTQCWWKELNKKKSLLPVKNYLTPELCLISLAHNMIVMTSFSTYNVINGCYSFVAMITLYMLAFMERSRILVEYSIFSPCFHLLFFSDSWNKTMKSSGRGHKGP